MPFDITTAIPIKEDEQGIERPDIGFDISSAKPVSAMEDITFKALDNTGILMSTVKDLFRGSERGAAGLGSGIEYLGRSIEAEAKSDTYSPFASMPFFPKSLWRQPKPKNKIVEAVDNFFAKHGNTIAEIGKTAKDFYNEAANKGIESPNPAIMLGWKHPFRKTISLAAENFPMLAVAAGVTAITKQPVIGAATFFPAIAGDMYEDAVKNGVDPIRASDMAMTTGAVQTALETIPLTGWMKGGNMLKRVFRVALQEGLIEEGSQQIFDNSLRIIGWKEPRPVWDRLTDGLAESILAGAVSGGALGMFEAPSIEDVRYDIHSQVIQDGMKQGLDEQQISDTIDKVDEVIDKTFGTEEIKPEITPEVKKAKIIRGVVELLPGEEEILPTMKEMISIGEAGRRIRTEEGGIIPIESSFPSWFRDKGYTKKETLDIINNVVEGKSVTERQKVIFQDLFEGYKNDLRILEERYAREEEQARIEAEGIAESEINETLQLAEEDAQSEFDEDIYRDLETEPSEGIKPLAMAEEGAEVIGTARRGLGIKPKIVPEVTEKMVWEKTEPWQVNLGRDITGVFEKHIGPKLQVSKRLKKWLGVYYPMLSSNGLIRVRSIADEKTLFHETGHFLDDALGGIEISRKKAIRNELVAVSKTIVPYDEHTVSKGYKAYRRSKVELFADYVAAYTLNPETCRTLAPNFTKQVEDTIGKDKEWNYVIDKLHQFEDAMKPLKEYVNSLRKIPEIQPWLKEWVERGNLLQQLWRNKVGDKVWEVYSKAIENLGKKTGVSKAFFEKGGINDTVFEILRQRRKLIRGQQQKLKEELIEPISELSKEDQQYIAESLQRFGDTMKDTGLNKLTETARKELALWGNEARKLGLLNDEVFWNNVGQYFPFFYDVREFEKNKRSFGYFPAKAIKAKFESLKHRLSDEELGRRVLEAQYGTWPSAKKKIAQYSKEELIELGRNAREEMGLIKTAAYPLQKRLFSMIEMVYTVKAFNTIATIPGLTGHKGVDGFDKMPEGRKYGAMSGAYVPVELVKEVSKWNNMRDSMGELWRNANTIWKIFKVPYNPAAVSRNMITNALMAWMGDVPVYNPVVAVKGIKSFIAKDEAYKILRDRGLYHNTYSEQELKELAFRIDEDPNNPHTQLMKWANNLGEAIQSPARLYGAIEDASKTVIARYVLDNGGTPEQAIKLADKLLFDYSQVSEVVGYARQGFFPFITWSAKILPRLVEFAIRKPEKFIMIIAMTEIFNAISRAMLGIDKDDEERIKPDYIRAKTALLMPERDINGDLNWIDLTYFLPWGGWLPIEKGKPAIPQTITMSNPLMTLYNAYVLNYDPFYGAIAPEYLPDDEQMIEKGKYVAKSLLPQVLTMSPGKIIKSTRTDRYGRKGDVGRTLFGELTGIKFTADTSAYRKNILQRLQRQFYEGRTRVRRQLQAGEITREQADEKMQKLREKFEREKESH